MSTVFYLVIENAFFGTSNNTSPSSKTKLTTLSFKDSIRSTRTISLRLKYLGQTSRNLVLSMSTSMSVNILSFICNVFFVIEQLYTIYIQMSNDKTQTVLLYAIKQCGTCAQTLKESSNRVFVFIKMDDRDLRMYGDFTKCS